MTKQPSLLNNLIKIIFIVILRKIEIRQKSRSTKKLFERLSMQDNKLQL
jgi:hypothetical protein